jgi:hypothetical protein
MGVAGLGLNSKIFAVIEAPQVNESQEDIAGPTITSRSAAVGAG